MRHADNDTLTGKLMRNYLEAITLETGSKHQIWDLNPQPWQQVITNAATYQ